MLTNIYRIGGLHQVSWFQLVPDAERIPPTAHRKNSGFQDVAAIAVAMAHMRLQEEGHLSCWTVLSQKDGGLTRTIAADDKIKLWIFTPGIHEAISSSVHPLIAGLKVVGAGLWCSPGDNEEVASAFCEALRNRIERSLKGMSYVRFGDVFVKSRRHGTLESRKVLPTCELMFMGSEDAVYVHVIVRRKRVRLLAANDLQSALALQRKDVTPTHSSLAVVVAPYGSSGRLTGCCPGDLVIQLHRSKLQAFSSSSVPFRAVASSTYGGGAVHSCYAEVRVGQVQGGAQQSARLGSSAGNTASSQGNDSAVDQARDGEDEGHVKAADWEKSDGKVLIYPLEAVLAPVLPPIPARTYLRRCWLQEWAGTHWLEDNALPGLNWCTTDFGPGKYKSKYLVGGANGTGLQKGSGSSNSSSSGSGGSSIKSSSSRGSGSSTSGSSGSSDGEIGTVEGELEGDADSLTSKAAGLVGGTSSLRTNNQISAQNIDATVSNSGSKRNRGKASGLSEEPLNKMVKMSMSPSGGMSALIDGVGNAVSKKGAGNGGELTIQGSLSMGPVTPRGTGSQAGTPWDWEDDGMGLLGMDTGMTTDADILADFGDFDNFWDEDELNFGEPPGTAESQALMFDSFMDGVNTPGTTISMDGADRMLLPIIDFPMEGFGNLGSSRKELSGKGFKNDDLQIQRSGQFSPLNATLGSTIDPLSKAEAMMLFAPGYARVEIPSIKEEVAFSSTYIPESRNVFHQQSFKDAYVYGATPPPNSNSEVFDSKSEQVVDHHPRDDVGDSKLGAEAGGVWKSFSRQASNIHVTAMDSIDVDNMATSKMRGPPYKTLHEGGPDSNGPSLLESKISCKVEDSSGEFPTLDPRIFPPFKSASPVLATELDCALVQISMLCTKDGLSSSLANRPVGTSPNSGGTKSIGGVVKEELSQIQVDQLGRVLSKPPQVQKKKSLPSRIAGDADEDAQDGLRGAQVGVWRPVQAPRPQKISHSSMDSRIGSSAASPDIGNSVFEGGMNSGLLKPNHWQSVIDAIPLLAQQAAVASDIALDGECGDGPLGWLAFQERQRLRSSCGPDMSHTACGGMLSIRHSLDNAGVEYIDPLSAEVSPAMVANLLQSDIRVAITAAFGESAADGPLTSADWCRSRVQGDTSGSVCADSKEGISSITSAGGEPIAPSQGLGSTLGGLKGAMGLEDLDQHRGSGRNMENSSLTDQTRGDEAGTSDSDLQANSGGYGATLITLPTPALLVGYQEDWLKTSPSVLHMWEKAPLEPYAHPKPISYYVLCLGLDPLMSAASDFFQQLSSVYESCRLGTHVPGTTAGLTGLNSGSSKPAAPGFMVVDAPPQPLPLGSALGLAGDFMASMGSGWNLDDFRKALVRVCRTVPLSTNPSNVQRDPEQSQCTVVYVVSPSSEPADVLQITLDASQCLGASLSEKDRRATSFAQSAGTPGEDTVISPVVGFSTSRLVLQVLPSEVIMKGSGTVASQLDTLKEVAFGVYSKARRIQRKIVVPESTNTNLSSSRGRTGGMIQGGSTMPGMWRDCNTGRNSGVNSGMSSALESASLRSSWDGAWQPASRFGDSSIVTDGSPIGSEPQSAHEASRFLYEPLFVLADPGYPDPNANSLTSRSVGKEALRSISDDVTGSTPGLAAGLPESGTNSGVEGSDADTTGGGHAQTADLHCCYTWTDDWQWLVSVWTDARGELLDIFVLPLFGAQKDLGFVNSFSQVLQQGLQLLSMAIEAGSQHPRNIVISRLGGFTERECQEWYRTVMTVGGDESKKWPLQLWPGAASGNSSMQLQDMALLSDRTLGLASSSSRPPSPSPASSFSSRSKPLGVPVNLSRRQGQGLGATQLPMESKGLFQWVNSISLVSVRVEHSLQAVSISDMNALSGVSQGGTTSAGGNASGTTGVTTVKTLANTGASFMLVPTNSLRTLSPQPWLLPTASSASPLAQLLESSPLAPPLASAFVVSPPTPSPMSEFVQQAVKEDWPSTVHVGLIALSGNSGSLDAFPASLKSSKDFTKDAYLEAHRAVQSVAAQVHALSWLNVSPTILLRRSPLPFHCNVAQRLRRLLSYLDTRDALPRLPHTPL